MSREMPSFEVVQEIGTDEPIGAEELEAAAAAVLAGVSRDAAFMALGPVVSVDFTRGTIDLVCTVCGSTLEDVQTKIGRIGQVMLDSANAFEYEGSQTTRIAELVH